MRKIALPFALFFFSAGPAMAGWYHVENFSGTLGAMPVHLSLQDYASFGSGITAEGSYFYDSQLSSIALYGRRDGAKIALCEISGAKQFDQVIVQGSKTPVSTAGCPFSLTEAGAALSGSWSKDGKTYPVTLARVGQFDDTGTEGKLDGNGEIPFWGQTASHAFLGDYVLADSKLCLGSIKVMDKKAKTLVQTMSFDKEDCTAGLVMTPVYMNVQEQTEKGAETVTINFADGRMGSTEDYRFNAKQGRYVKVKD
jgi:hypothetical protein